MNRVKVLGEAVGIQWQGVTDNTIKASQGNGTALIVGDFRRGRIDKPMTIHLGNIRSELGYEPDNPDYAAVEGALDTGVPSVQVLRIIGLGNDHVGGDDGGDYTPDPNPGGDAGGDWG